MKIFVLIPVLNRLELTKKVLDCLRAQTTYHFFQIVIIDDGSSDGTASYLSEQSDVSLLRGDGSLWWAGAMQKGLDFVSRFWGNEDYLLFLNNDVIFGSDYVENLIKQSIELNSAAVGSIVCEMSNHLLEVVSIGPFINAADYDMGDVFAREGMPKIDQLMPYYEVDALSGRGVLYSVSFAKQLMGFRTSLLPHYLADYEYSIRFKAVSKLPLIVSAAAIIISPPVYGNDVSQMSFWARKFSKRSAENCMRTALFYMMTGDLRQKIRTPFYIAFFTLRDLVAFYFPILRRR